MICFLSEQKLFPFQNDKFFESRPNCDSPHIVQKNFALARVEAVLPSVVVVFT
jgi:hypothetical protein